MPVRSIKRLKLELQNKKMSQEAYDEAVQNLISLRDEGILIQNDSIMEMCSWDQTPQGFDYWAEIYRLPNR